MNSLRNMPPATPLHNAVDSQFPNPVGFCNVNLSIAQGYAEAYCLYVSFRENRVAVSLALWCAFWMLVKTMLLAARRTVNSFVTKIVHVVRMSSSKKVAWPYALPVVAMMTNFKPVGNFSNGDHPRNAVCVKLNAADFDSPVTTANFCAFEVPTFSNLGIVFWNWARVIYLAVESDNIFRGDLGAGKFIHNI